MIKLLGQGGFGRTYLAEDRDKLDEKCVVKQFVPMIQGTAGLQKALELFEREARQLQQLGHHPQIPALWAYFSENNQLYLIQQYIEGETLDKILQKQGVWTEQQVKELLISLLPVLKFIHQQKVIHRELFLSIIKNRSVSSIHKARLYLDKSLAAISVTIFESRIKESSQ
jgi:serine/threonine protein kinase